MNCKPGDLAVIVRTVELTHENLGRFVEVVRLAAPDEYVAMLSSPAWIVRACVGTLATRIVDQRTRAFIKIEQCRERPIADECLRPIRDPGADAVDEFARRPELEAPKAA